MYIVGKGHQHIGPGTSTVQEINWTTGQEKELAGLGCACGGKCSQGLGLFDSGWDISGWGAPEIGIAAVGFYMLYSTLFTTRAAARSVSSGVRKTRRKVGSAIKG